MITVTGHILTRSRCMISRELDGENTECERITYMMQSAEDASELYCIVDYDPAPERIYQTGKNTIPVEVFLYPVDKGVGYQLRVTRPMFKEELF